MQGFPDRITDVISSFPTADVVFIKRKWKYSFTKELWTCFPSNLYAHW